MTVAYCSFDDLWLANNTNKLHSPLLSSSINYAISLYSSSRIRICMGPSGQVSYNYTPEIDGTGSGLGYPGSGGSVKTSRRLWREERPSFWTTRSMPRDRQACLWKGEEGWRRGERDVSGGEEISGSKAARLCVNHHTLVVADVGPRWIAPLKPKRKSNVVCDFC